MEAKLAEREEVVRGVRKYGCGWGVKTELAEKLGLSRSYVSLVMNGRRVPSLGVAVRMARELGVTVEELMRMSAAGVEEEELVVN
jgi:transcriptional regulator with XRE-family HTH domain